MQTYKYSDDNEYELVLPEKYERILHKGAKKKKKLTRKDIFPIAIKVVAILGLIALVGVAGEKLYAYYSDFTYSEAKKSDVISVNEVVDEAEKRETPDYPEYEGSEEKVVSYPQVVEVSKLKQLSLVYPDFVCWFYIDDTTISYPVVYSSTPDYYLRRNMDGETNLSGTLYFDSRNNMKTFGGNTIIYGHAMQNGNMFGTLKEYKKKDYYEQHSKIYLYTPDEVVVYKIFAAYETTTDNYYIQTYFSSKDEYASFLAGCKNNSEYDTGVSVSADDDILTLSTCHYVNSSNGRFVVQAKKIGTTPIS